MFSTLSLTIHTEKKRETQKAHNLQTGKLARVLFFLCRINILMWTHHRRYPLYIPEDEYHFKMNNQGTSDQNPKTPYSAIMDFII